MSDTDDTSGTRGTSATNDMGRGVPAKGGARTRLVLAGAALAAAAVATVVGADIHHVAATIDVGGRWLSADGGRWLFITSMDGGHWR